MSIEGYKRNAGVNWPRKLRTSIGAGYGAIGVVEEIWGLAFKINLTLDASTFTFPK